MATLRGTDQADTLEGGPEGDRVALLGGNDRATAFDGDDTLFGGDGIDRISAGSGSDTLFGGTGSDSLWGEVGTDRLFGGGGNDRLEGGDDTGRLYGGIGNDRLTGGDADDALFGGAGNDTLRGDAGDDRLSGGHGSDTASYADAQGSVTVDLSTGRAGGAAGNDRLLDIEGAVGSAFADTLTGSMIANRLVGGAGTDSLRGAAGDDVLAGGGGNDRLNGGAGIDFADLATARGPVQVDLVAGRASGADGYDRLVGIEGAIGSAFADRLAGNDAANTFQGGGGNDSINGGAGLDVAVFTGNAADFTIERSGGAVVVTDRRGAADAGAVLRMQDVEWLKFDDGMLEVGDRIGRLQPLENSPPRALASLGASGFVIVGDGEHDYFGTSVSSAGDINGDGFDELVIGAPSADGVDDGHRSAGEVYLIWGHAEQRRSDVVVSELSSADVLRLYGGNSNDRAGSGVSAGDFNGDGFNDLVIGAKGIGYVYHYSDAHDGAYSYSTSWGATYPLFGREGDRHHDLNLVDLRPPEGLTVVGTSRWSSSGEQVESVGDTNGDGFDDVIIVEGGTYATPYGWFGQGAYVLFGQPRDPTEFDTDRGFRLGGESDFNYSGQVRANSASDFNGDGLDDLIAAVATRDRHGSVVIYGRLGHERPDVSLDSLAFTDGLNLVHRAASWLSQSSGGDVNGDGFADVIVGEPFADLPNSQDVGKVWVIYGRPEGEDSTIDLPGLTASDGFAIIGSKPEGWLGASMSAAGDVNGDGTDDFILAAPSTAYPSTPGTHVTEIFIIYGREAASRDDIDLARLSPADGFRIEVGIPARHSTFDVAGAGDVNGDGFDDLAATRIVDGADETYVIYGANFTGALTALGTAAAETLIGTSSRDDIVAAQGNDRVLGLAGDDVLKGGAGNDVLKGGTGNDLLEGDSGRDLVVLAPGDGDDRLRDFENGRDRIDLRAFDGLAFADLAITTGTASGGPGTLVEIDAATSLRLLGIPAGYLDAGDFLFA